MPPRSLTLPAGAIIFILIFPSFIHFFVIIDHQLWHLLDRWSKKATPRNYLTWRGNVIKNDKITVEHFGLLGWEQHEENQQIQYDYSRSNNNPNHSCIDIPQQQEEHKLSPPSSVKKSWLKEENKASKIFPRLQTSPKQIRREECCSTKSICYIVGISILLCFIILGYNNSSMKLL